MKGISYILLLTLVACASRENRYDFIQEPIMNKYSEFQDCYRESDTYLKKKDARIDYQFSIEQDGSTTDHKIVSQVPKDPNFAFCFTSVMKTLQYQMPERTKEQKLEGFKGRTKMTLPPAGKIEIKQPFMFHSGVAQ